MASRIKNTAIEWVRAQQKKSDRHSLRGKLRDWLFGSFVHAGLRERWESKFSRGDFSPAWKIKEVPPELQLAVETEWFPKGGSVLDVGCGFGDISHWLAQQGYSVLGFDWSKAAVEKAIETYGQTPGTLEFLNLDATDLPPSERKFDAILDRGCLHVISWSHGSKYAESIASWAKPQAACLLLLATTCRGSEAADVEDDRKKTVAYVKEILAEHFSIERIEETGMSLDYAAASGAVALPAIAVWGRRK